MHDRWRAGDAALTSYANLEAENIRLRSDHITMAGSHEQHMQKTLERMNLKIHDVISDLTGVSGLNVIRAILAGERNPVALLALCDGQIRKNKAQWMQEALEGTWKAEHLFALRQALEGWEFYQKQMGQCDQAIEKVLREIVGPEPTDGPKPPPRRPSAGASTRQRSRDCMSCSGGCVGARIRPKYRA